jgi:hypothetical protein
MGKLLVFPANIRLDWKVIVRKNTQAYLASSTVMREKCFITLTPGLTLIKTFLIFNDSVRMNKLARSSL